jgi:hypothetical protein
MKQLGWIRLEKLTWLMIQMFTKPIQSVGLKTETKEGFWIDDDGEKQASEPFMKLRLRLGN